MADLSPIRRFVDLTGGLAVISVARPDGQVASSLVNAGLVAHPTRDEEVVGLVLRGDARTWAPWPRASRAA